MPAFFCFCFTAIKWPCGVCIFATIESLEWFVKLNCRFFLHICALESQSIVLWCGVQTERVVQMYAKKLFRVRLCGRVARFRLYTRYVHR